MASTVNVPSGSPTTFFAVFAQNTTSQPSNVGRIIDSGPSISINLSTNTDQLGIYGGTNLHSTSTLGLTWHVGAGVYNQGSSELWLDGALEATGSAGSSSGTGTYVIGSWPGSPGSFGYFQGKLGLAMILQGDSADNPALIKRISESLGFTFCIATY